MSNVPTVKVKESSGVRCIVVKPNEVPEVVSLDITGSNIRKILGSWYTCFLQPNNYRYCFDQSAKDKQFNCVIGKNFIHGPVLIYKTDSNKKDVDIPENDIPILISRLINSRKFIGLCDA